MEGIHLAIIAPAENLKAMVTRIILFCFLVASCSQPYQTLKKSELIREHFESLNGHNLTMLRKNYADSAVGQSPNWGRIMHGSDSILYQYGRLFLSTPDLKFEILNTRLGQDHATVEYTISGTLSNLEKDVPEFMRGKRYSFPAITVFEFRNDLIVYEASYFDQVAFLKQMGFFDQK